MSHAATTHSAAHETAADKRQHAADEKKEAGAKAAKPRDAAADQTQLLLLLAEDWLNNDRSNAPQIQGLVDALTATTAAPVNVDVPYVTQVGATLTCTMGNWTGSPTAYAYDWHMDGVTNGATGAVYTVQPDDSGHDLACVVTATNAIGSTAAPMSNAVTIA
jgi:hypothetical protein